MDTESLDIYTDGGSRKNPGKAACAFVVLDKSHQILFQQGFYLGITTNNVAEYSAVIKALEWVSANKPSIKIIQFFLDSSLVVNQINRRFKVKDEGLKNLYYLVSKLIDNLKFYNFIFTYIPRENNYRADALVNKTLDNI